MRAFRNAVLITILSALAASCGGRTPFSAQRFSPHEQYLDMLRRAGVDETALGQDWVQASTAALLSPVPVTLPFREAGYFPPDEAMAVAYRLEVQRGRRLAISIEYDTTADGRLFVDLFRQGTDAEPRLVASMEPDALALLFDIDRDGVYILRLQPELLRGGRFLITERTLASLPFPVPGLTARAIQSGFGALRDPGVRTHEGVDVFAPRGTPVVAVADGVARPGTNALGGNVVWLRELPGGLTFYYAHLDSQAVTSTARVRAGDVLGFVGNTGNARTTSPHLHFGIYDRGAIDPAPFLRPDDATPAGLRSEARHLGELVRVTARSAPLRQGPDPRTPGGMTLSRGAIARVLGHTSATARVMLPDSSMGYVPSTAIASADPPLARERLASKVALLQMPATGAPVVEVLEAGVQVDVIGRFGAYRLLRVPGGRAGWALA